LSGGMPNERGQDPLLPSSPAETGLLSFLPDEAAVSLDGFPEDI